MDGFYSVWSKPYLDRKNTNEYRMHDFELLTFILSIIMWQKLNGKASIYADDAALKYLETKDVLRLFNGEVKSFSVDKDINSAIFWAAGKLFAIKNTSDNMAMVDLDLIVWSNLDDVLKDNDLYVIHREEITDHVYPDYENFPVKDYVYNSDWNKKVEPCNTALLCYKDSDFIKNYAEESIRFMKACLEKNDNLCPMVFAEQRLISIMADKYNKKIGAMFEHGSDIGLQDKVTHIWGHKNILKFNFEERYKFCKRILNRIKEENSEAFDLCIKNKAFQKYI